MITLADILNKLPKPARDQLVARSKIVFNLGWTEHSNELIAKIVLAHAKTLPLGRTRIRLTALATFFVLHPEMCYDDFTDYFVTLKGWKDDSLRDELIAALKNHPMVRKLIRHQLQKHWPNLGDDKW